MRAERSVGAMRNLPETRPAIAATALALALAMSALAVGCAPSVSPSSGPSQAAAATCSATADGDGFGCGPVSDGSITYQPDVVFVRGGAAAIRSREPNGVSWTIDGNAPGADQIQVGKVVFVTDRVVGKVVSAATVGSDIRVTFGPADMGQIIRDGTIRWNGPLSLESAIPIVTPDVPGLATDNHPGPSPEARSNAVAAPVRALPQVDLVVARSGSRAGAVTAAEEDTPAEDTPVSVYINPDFHFGALCCTKRMGAVFSIDQNGKRLKGEIWLRMNHPTYDGYASFLAGELIDGMVEFEGIEGIHLEFEAGTDAGPPPVNIDQRYLLPVEYLARSKGHGVPPLTTAWQGYVVQTAFSAGSTSLFGSADYTFNSNVVHAEFNAAGVTDVRLPTGFTTRTPLLDTLTGVSVGVNGFVLGMINQLCLCYGSSVYTNGLYIQLRAAFGVSNDSSAVAMLGARCRAVVFKMDATVGAGHHLWQGFADQINEDYALKGDAQITPDFGVSQEIPLWERYDSMPVGFKRCG